MILFGVATFFAFVGIALLGGDNLVVAGSGCHGAKRCHGGKRCHGAKRNARKCDGATLTKERGKKVRCHGRKRCSGSKATGGEIAPPPPKEARAPQLRRAPLAHYRVSYR